MSRAGDWPVLSGAAPESSAHVTHAHRSTADLAVREPAGESVAAVGAGRPARRTGDRRQPLRRAARRRRTSTRTRGRAVSTCASRRWSCAWCCSSSWASAAAGLVASPSAMAWLDAPRRAGVSGAGRHAAVAFDRLRAAHAVAARRAVATRRSGNRARRRVRRRRLVAVVAARPGQLRHLALVHGRIVGPRVLGAGLGLARPSGARPRGRPMPARAWPSCSRASGRTSCSTRSTPPLRWCRSTRNVPSACSKTCRSCFASRSPRSAPRSR